MKESIPRKLGRYRPIALIAKGGMGAAYLAIVDDEGAFNRLVVVKVLRRDLALEAEFVSMFRDEARVATGLSHPNVVQTYEFGHADGFYFIVMEFVDGLPLNQILKMPPEARTVGFGLRILIDVLAGLQAVHDLTDTTGAHLGLIHRDVSPHNVMVSYSGHAKLLDFGISKSAASSHRTSTGVLKGKLAYMAPEQARFETVDHRADLFAVGALLWEVLYGQRMWIGVAEQQIIVRLIRGDFPKAPDAGAELPEALHAILARALANEPANRYATASEFAADLELVVETLPCIESSRRGMASVLADQFGVQRERCRRIVEEATARLQVAESPAHAPSMGRMAMFPQSGESRARVASVATEAEKGIEPDAARASSPPLVSSVVALPRPRRNIGLAAGVALVLVGVVGLCFPSFVPAPRSTAQASLPALANQSRFRVNVVPVGAAARVWLDGREIPDGIDLPVLKDVQEHALVVQAEGYARHDSNVRFDGPPAVQVTLVPSTVGTSIRDTPLSGASRGVGATVLWRARPVLAQTQETGAAHLAPVQSPPSPRRDPELPTRPERPILETLGKDGR